MTRDRDYGVGVVGVGKYLPDRVLSNADLERSTGMSAAEIEEKTGIRERRQARDDETASEMSAAAARDALAMAGIAPEELGLIITCTFTGDYVYPAVSCRIQDIIGARNAGAFDIMANCTGFQVGLGVASDRLLADPSVGPALVVGTALQSRFINYADAASAIYFGDGVGAAVLDRVDRVMGSSPTTCRPTAAPSTRSACAVAGRRTPCARTMWTRGSSTMKSRVWRFGNRSFRISRHRSVEPWRNWTRPSRMWISLCSTKPTCA
jgi:3-oxoacyl-(acyl-carrier-protein) synthase III